MTDKKNPLHIYYYAVGSLKIGGFGGLCGQYALKSLLLFDCDCPLTESHCTDTHNSGGRIVIDN